MANLLLGLFYLEHDQPTLAVPPLDAAERLAPNDARIKTGLAIAFVQSNQYDDARKAIERLKKLQGNPAIVARLSGALLQAGGQAAEADLAYKAASRLEPGAGSAFARGLELLSAGDFLPARSVFAAGLRDRSAA